MSSLGPWLTIIVPMREYSNRLRTPGMTPPTTKPRIVPNRLEERAFVNSPAAILSLFRKPIRATMKLPTARTSNPIGNGCSARMPGTQVGSRAKIVVVEKMPTTRDALPETRAMFEASLMSLGALLRAP